MCAPYPYPTPPQALLYWGAVKREWAHPIRSSFVFTPLLTSVALVAGEPRTLMDGEKETELGGFCHVECFALLCIFIFLCVVELLCFGLVSFVWVWYGAVSFISVGLVLLDLLSWVGLV